MCSASIAAARETMPHRVCAVSSKHRRERARKSYMSEHKSAHVGLVWNDALAADEQLFGEVTGD
jgi:hypothetical protein